MTSLKEYVAIAALCMAAMLTVHPCAEATPEPAAPSDKDVAAALRAATVPSLSDTLSKFFAHAPGQPAQAPPPTVSVESTAIPVYELTREFVTGVPDTPVGQLAYQAVPAHASDGRSATLWIVRSDDGQWQLGNIASDDREAALAATLPPGAKLLHEPQVDAWYSLSGGRVSLMDAGRSDYTEGTVHTLHDYQRAMADRYGDEARSRKGTEPSPDRDAAHSHGQSDEHVPSFLVPVGLGGLVLVTVGGGLVLSRRKKKT